MALRAHQIALDSIRLLRPLVERIARHDRSLAEQLRRAASSVVLNIAEGAYSQGGNGRARFYNAAGSASEARSALEVAVAWGYVTTPQAAAASDRLDHVVAVGCRAVTDQFRMKLCVSRPGMLQFLQH